jgi:hypothetical protein
MAKPGKAEKWAARGERLSAALRENLKRRKEQARERDLQRSPARQSGSGAETPGTEAEGSAQTPEFRRNRGEE